MRAGDDQWCIPGGQTVEHLIAQTITDKDGIELVRRDPVDAFLEIKMAGFAIIMMTDRQEFQRDVMRGKRRQKRDFPAGYFTGEDFEHELGRHTGLDAYFEFLTAF